MTRIKKHHAECFNHAYNYKANFKTFQKLSVYFQRGKSGFLISTLLKHKQKSVVKAQFLIGIQRTDKPTSLSSYIWTTNLLKCWLFL